MNNNSSSFENPLSELISDEIYGLLKSKNLINEKTLRDYQIKKRFRELRENNYSASESIEMKQLSDQTGAFQVNISWLLRNNP